MVVETLGIGPIFFGVDSYRLVGTIPGNFGGLARSGLEAELG